MEDEDKFVFKKILKNFSILTRMKMISSDHYLLKIKDKKLNNYKFNMTDLSKISTIEKYEKINKHNRKWI